MKHAYICDNCERVTVYRSWIFNCNICGKEICEDCMYGWAVCKECARNKSDDELKEEFFR